MMILDANYTFNKGQLLFTFLADNRVDFRKLAKDLATKYKTRIELRQVGVRDKAKEIGGYGSCGQALCCSKFLTDFDSVSINMAKNQNIALNPTKINGVCGRLLCCLKYENECYKELNKTMPKINSKVKTEFGEGKVISIDPLNQSYRVEIKEHGIEEIKVNLIVDFICIFNIQFYSETFFLQMYGIFCCRLLNLMLFIDELLK